MFETKYSNFKTGKNIGEQHGAKFAPASAAPEYQQVGSSDRYPDHGHKGPMSRRTSRENMRAPFLNGGGNKQVSAHYAFKKHGAYPSEGAKNTLISPTSRPPKKA